MLLYCIKSCTCIITKLQQAGAAHEDRAGGVADHESELSHQILGFSGFRVQDLGFYIQVLGLQGQGQGLGFVGLSSLSWLLAWGGVPLSPQAPHTPNLPSNNWLDCKLSLLLIKQLLLLLIEQLLLLLIGARGRTAAIAILLIVIIVIIAILVTTGLTVLCSQLFACSNPRVDRCSNPLPWDPLSSP